MLCPRAPTGVPWGELEVHKPPLGGVKGEGGFHVKCYGRLGRHAKSGATRWNSQMDPKTAKIGSGIRFVPRPPPRVLIRTKREGIATVLHLEMCEMA